MTERKKYTASKKEPALLLHIYIASKKERKKEKQTNKMACAPSEDSDQPGHPPDQSFRFPHEESLSPYLPIERTVEDSDQTGRMPRLIWVFAGRKDHFVGLVMRRLIH